MRPVTAPPENSRSTSAPRRGGAACSAEDASGQSRPSAREPAPGSSSSRRAPLHGYRIPLAVLFVALVLLALPMVALADGSTGSSVSASEWGSIVTGILGALAGGGALYRQYSGNGEARLARIEEAQRALEGKTSEWLPREDFQAWRDEFQGRLSKMDEALAEIKTQSDAIARQNVLILAALDKLGGQP